MEANSIDNFVLGVDLPEGGEICLSYKPTKEEFSFTFWKQGDNKNYMEQMIINKEDNVVKEKMAGFFDKEGIYEIIGAKPKKLIQYQQVYFDLKNKLEEINESYRNQQPEEASAK